jgi:hypothetical protein
MTSGSMDFSRRRLQARLLAGRFSSAGICEFQIEIFPSATRCSPLSSALQESGEPIGRRFAYLKDLLMPVLIVGGRSDIIFYTIN